MHRSGFRAGFDELTVIGGNRERIAQRLGDGLERGRAAGEVGDAAYQPQDKLPSRPLDQWSKTVMGNIKRMATDEDYRKSIARKLS